MEQKVKDKLNFERYFTKGLKGEEVYDSFKWNKVDIDIVDDAGKKLFTQKDVTYPANWSPLAIKIAASKYFYGEQGTDTRECSVKQLVGRVSEKFSNWAIKDKYFNSKEEAGAFRDDVAHLALNQNVAFNSPVWFNVGIDKYKSHGKIEKKKTYITNDKGKVVNIPLGREKEYPQTSACFIQSVDDTMESIMQLAVNEALLFKYGSGSGTDLSTLRSSREKLSGGGKPSGPLAYLIFYDDVAGIVKSGGKTRRAAKMDSLKVWHPDIMEFIKSKMREEKKMHLLMDNGIGYREAADTVAYQNTNISVRLTDEFMKTVEKDGMWQTIPVNNKEMVKDMPKYKAKKILEEIAKGTHFCGDPGVQYGDTINEWHTCKKSNRINASNPCSEYMFIDNSSCNLASLNLMSFLAKDETFNIGQFKKAIRTTAIAQDLEFDNSSFPTKEIARNSHKFKPLGMGYANLGSLLMYHGMPYDSEEARATAGAITALLTGNVYETSIEMAQKLGPFEEYKKNKKPMLEVIKMHKDSLKKINRSKIPSKLVNILDEAENVWGNVVEKGKKYGFRNAQATVLAPTGTIGFMMDCDTKGIEPEIGLVQTKLLADGGILKLVNGTVEPTLKRLGYETNKITEILNYVRENETIEGSGLKEEHLPIFDCSNKPSNGKRTISYNGHIKMMAAVQPFLSGAISKTVNMPKEATVKDIEQLYMDAWKMGIKSLAIYRDGSKRCQPLSFSEKALPNPIRRKLPTTRKSIGHKFDIAGHEGYIHIGLYEDNTPGEIFINMNKEGSTIGGLMDAFATSLSLNLQYGVPLKSLVDKFKNQTFEPRGLVLEGAKEKGIHTAKSIVDYVARFLEVECLNGKENKNGVKVTTIQDKKIPEKEEEKNLEEKVNESPEKKEKKFSGEKGGFCPVCGLQLYKEGHCNEVCSGSDCDYVDTKGCGG